MNYQHTKVDYIFLFYVYGLKHYLLEWKWNGNDLTLRRDPTRCQRHRLTTGSSQKTVVDEPCLHLAAWYNNHEFLKAMLEEGHGKVINIVPCINFVS